MIDFRYHLVSLISVFLALAVGLVLGAGPLKGPISGSLQEQVDTLREDSDRLRTDLDTANGDKDKLNEYIVAVAPQLLADTLSERTVTILRAPSASADHVTAITDRLAEAGATAVDGGRLTSNTMSTEGMAEVVQQLRAIDDTLPSEPGEALLAALARATSTGARENSYTEQQASDTLDVLRSAGRLDGGEAANTHAVIYVAGPESGTGNDPLAADSQADTAPENNPHVRVAEALAAAAPTVVAGTSANASNGVVATLRSTNAAITTVDGIELSAGAVLVAMATAVVLNQNSTGSFGFADNAEQLLPGQS